MPAKLPVANFKTQSEWLDYLAKLTPAQTKKVATALNKILRTEYRLNIKKAHSELLEDIKRLYSVNNNTKLLQLVNGIEAEDLPQPSSNVPKPTKKQAAESARLEGERKAKKLESAKLKVAEAKQRREARQAEEQRMKQEEEQRMKQEEEQRMKQEEGQRMKQAEEQQRMKPKLNKSYSDKEALIENWGTNQFRYMDIYLYRDYNKLNIEGIQRFVDKIKKDKKAFAINFLAHKLPIELIDEVYNKYGLKTLLIGLTNMSADLFGKDYPMFWDTKALPKVKMNKEFRKFYDNEDIRSADSADSEETKASQLKGYNNIIKTINEYLP